jgi:hypothetical protein
MSDGTHCDNLMPHARTVSGVAIWQPGGMTKDEEAEILSLVREMQPLEHRERHFNETSARLVEIRARLRTLGYLDEDGKPTMTIDLS